MKNNEKSRILWACRRGMLELDIIIMRFFKKKYDHISYHQQKLFIELLKCDDIDLFNWIINRHKPQNIKLQHIIQLIHQNNSLYYI
ncbi:FAD assembly factor SdhE [Candidatus Ishikawella capsulata]|uniref:FAD assembly factor SdhE n=1 Tax=Candidatus Ishikawaella capsulata Mpkobe TaxID=476281 RepID=C5WCE9_9ENTR|nr:succinate dehydrogenase assembly factor 2 [Candidatus Ishikawaella capsulata]BAH83005.1 TFIIB like protein [Candidatus Ishikawaella capsulata Mpkobe]